jgi:hypothetical protein
MRQPSSRFCDEEDRTLPLPAPLLPLIDSTNPRRRSLRLRHRNTQNLGRVSVAPTCIFQRDVSSAGRIAEWRVAHVATPAGRAHQPVDREVLA